MVVDQINVMGIAGVHPKHQPPIAGDGQALKTLHVASQLVQAPTGIQSHLPRLPRLIEQGQHVRQLLDLSWSEALGVAPLVKSPQPLMPKRSNSHDNI
jgi:hypothetical protein